MKGRKKEKTVDRGRRRFLKLGLAAGVGLAVGVYGVTGGERVKDGIEVWDHVPPGWKADAWLHIAEDDTVTVRVNHSEMGQGITTALPMILAEELDADWSKVRFEFAQAESVYKNPEYGTQMTAGSTSVRTSWDILRLAGATARRMLILAGAQTWGVNPDRCFAETGRVIDKAGGRSLSYGQLAATASGLEPPARVTLKDSRNFNLIGRNLPRLDSLDKITGRARFGIDVSLPGMLSATVIHPPVFGSRLIDFKAGSVEEMPGVRWVGAISSGLAVVADTFWQAKQAAEDVEITWSDDGRSDVDTKTLRRRWEKLSESGDYKKVYTLGDYDSTRNEAVQTLRAAYMLPYQAHATPEPMNATAHLHDGICEVWAPTQHQDAAQEETARVTGLPYHKIRIHTTYLGGGYGRRVSVDYVTEAVELARHLKKPVKVLWTREEDIRHDRYRPAGYNLMEAGLGERGAVQSWRHLIVGPDHMAACLPELAPSMLPYALPRLPRRAISWLGRQVLPRVVPGKKVMEGAAPLPYDIEHVRVDYIHDDPGVPVGFWRSVGHSSNCFVVESFLDEIAAAANKDPVELRLELLRNNQPLSRVVEMAAARAEWGRSTESGVGWGVAAHDFHETLLCCVAQVRVDARGRIRVPRVVCAVDCGVVVHPRTAERQVRGGIVFGLTATLNSSISIGQGRVNQSNFGDFPLLTMKEMPDCEVYFADSDRRPTGLGEAAVPIIAPAVANAVYAATGVRVREIPITPNHILEAGKKG